MCKKKKKRRKLRDIGHKRVSEFTEEDFISAIETYLARAAYPRYDIEITRISQDEERDLGYDGVMTCLVPFYIQFKRSCFNTPEYKGQLAYDRLNCGFADKEGFFSFRLHKDRQTHGYDQHNALFKLSQASKAAYVAPLFYKRRRLSSLKALSSMYPWTLKDIIVLESRPIPASVRFRRVRLLHDCITIPPHKDIPDRLASHHYSFTQRGNVCYHSDPERLDIPHLRFLEFLQEVIEKVISIDRKAIPNAIAVIKLLPELMGTYWSARYFKALIKNYLIDLDLVSERSTRSIETIVFKDLSETNRYLLTEHVVREEFSIVQYIVRVGKI